jgi:hypothetical protein
MTFLHLRVFMRGTGNLTPKKGAATWPAERRRPVRAIRRRLHAVGGTLSAVVSQFEFQARVSN